MIKQALKYEIENKDKLVLHLMINKEHVNMFESITAFLTWCSSVFIGIFGTEPSTFPVVAANLEMDNVSKSAHWHVAFYTSAESQDKLKEFVTLRTGAAAYLAVCFKNQLAGKIGVEKKNAKSIKGVSIIKPELKKMSQIDYMLKEGVNEFTVIGLEPVEDAEVDFDVWGTPATSEFYRKNCSGPKPEGGVRALYPGRPGPALAKRGAKDEIDIDETVSFFVSKGYVPTEEEFRVHMYKEHGQKSFSKQTYALINALIVQEIGVPKLSNPREKVTSIITAMNDRWIQFARSMLDNRLHNHEVYKRQLTYFNNAQDILSRSYIQDVYGWVYDFVFIDQEARDTQKNKALVIEGNSNCGKSAFMELIFPLKVFGCKGLTMDMRYATHGMYNKDCHLWVYRDINRGLSIDNMFRFQNIIDGDETLREINKPEVQGLYPARPILGATTTDIVESFRARTADREDLRTRVEQFINRLIVVRFPESVAVYKGDTRIDKSPLLKFLTLTKYLDVPEWMPFYLFWRYYFKFEEQKGDDNGFGYIDDILTLCGEVLPLPGIIRDTLMDNELLSDQQKCPESEQSVIDLDPFSLNN